MLVLACIALGAAADARADDFCGSPADYGGNTLWAWDDVMQLWNKRVGSEVFYGFSDVGEHRFGKLFNRHHEPFSLTLRPSTYSAACLAALAAALLSVFAAITVVALAYEALAAQAGHKVDGMRPRLQQAVAGKDELVLSYDEALDEDSTTTPGDFTVTVAGSERTLTRVLVSGSEVTLPLDSAVTSGETVTVSYRPGANPIQDTAGNEAAALTNQPVTNRTGDKTARSGGTLPEKAVRQIEALLGEKEQRTPAQRKVGSQLLDAWQRARGQPAPHELVEVDIRADVTPEVLARIRALGGTVINSVPRYRSIRAQLPLSAVTTLAALDAIQSIRTADEARTRLPPDSCGAK